MTNEERIAAAKAKLAEVEARRTKAAAEQAAAQRVADAEREAAVALALEEATGRHGPLGRKVLVVHAKYADGTILGTAIVRSAPDGEWKRFRARLQNAKGVEIQTAHENLWRPQLVWPELGEVERMIEELPYFSELLADAVGYLCGVRSEDVAGK